MQLLFTKHEGDMKESDSKYFKIKYTKMINKIAEYLCDSISNAPTLILKIENVFEWFNECFADLLFI